MARSQATLSTTLPSVQMPVKTGTKRSAISQLLVAEPFRPFFFLGWIVSLIGLLIWPLYFAGALKSYPGLSHAYLMVQFFVGSFAVGFLWTALPRMLEVPGPGRFFVFGGIGFIIIGVFLHLNKFYVAGHCAFLGLLSLVLLFAIRRYPARRDLPPPSFVLVIFGLLSGFFGTVLTAAGEAGWIAGFGYRAGRILLTDYFLLFLVVGISAFLAPRFLEQKAHQGFASSRKATPIWAKRAKIATATALILTAGALLQSAGAVRIGALITALPLTLYVLFHVRIWQKQPNLTWPSIGMRLSLLSAIAAPWTRVFMPEARLFSAHLLLLGGFSLLTLTIGARVTFGHSGYEKLFRAKMHTIGAVIILYVASLVVRLWAEFSLLYWSQLLLISSGLLILAHLIWGILIIPKIFKIKIADH